MNHMKIEETEHIWGLLNEPLQTDLETDPEKLPPKDL